MNTQINKFLIINNGYPIQKFTFYSTYIKIIRECVETAGFKTEICVLDVTGKKIYDYIRFYIKLLLTDLKKFDLIFIHNWEYCFQPLIFKNLKNINLVINWHGTDIIPGHFFNKILNKISYNYIRANFVFISPSIFLTQKIKKIKSLEKNRCVEIPSGGIDTSIFKPDFNEKKAAVSRNNLYKIGYASGLSKKKGCFVLLKAVESLIKKINDIKIIIIDYGADSAEFKSAAQSMNIYDFFDFVPVADKNRMPDFYRNIDVFVFPTLYEESLGLVGLESLSCGAPVIGSRIGALPEYIKDDKAFLFEPDNHLELAEKLYAVYMNRNKFKDFKNQFYNFVRENYSQEFVVKKYKELFSEILRSER